MAKRVRLFEGTPLATGECRVLPHQGPVPYRSLLLSMTDRGLRVYFNVCRHVPVPLDAGSFVAPVDDGDWVCDTHGARYDLSSGYCHTGPCLGSSLLPVRVELEDGVLYGWFGEDGGPET